MWEVRLQGSANFTQKRVDLFRVVMDLGQDTILIRKKVISGIVKVPVQRSTACWLEIGVAVREGRIGVNRIALGTTNGRCWCTKLRSVIKTRRSCTGGVVGLGLSVLLLAWL